MTFVCIFYIIQLVVSFHLALSSQLFEILKNDGQYLNLVLNHIFLL